LRQRRFNGFDILVAVVVVLAVVLLAYRALRHTGTAGVTPQKTVVLSVTSAPTINWATFQRHLVPGRAVTVSAAGSFIPLGTLSSLQVQPYVISVPNAQGKLVLATDPRDRQFLLKISVKAAVASGEVTVNGNPFLIGQGVLLEEGGAEVSGTITSYKVE